MSLPRYKFDPVTQRYTLLTPQEKQQAEQKEGIRSSDGGGPDSAPVGPGLSMMDPGMAEFGVGAQNIGFGLSGIPSMATQVAGLAATAIGNAMMGSQVSQVAPDTAQVTSISPNQEPVAALASMIAQSQQEQDDEAAQAAQEAAVAAVAEAATDTAAAAPSADAAADAAATGGDSSGGGGGDGSDGMGGFGSAGGEGPSGNAAGTAGVGDGEKEGGLISMKRYADGGMTMSPQNYGRMGDSMLVHMNPREVAGLQSLARSQGTSMTVNPQTGYPEAFNLQALLPTLIGLGLTAATGGAAAAPLIAGMSNAATIGLGTGALTAAATGSLKKGLQAGLGAYGGAGIGEGIIGTTAATPVPGMEGAAVGSTGTTPLAPRPIDFSNAAGESFTLPGGGDTTLASSYTGSAKPPLGGSLVGNPYSLSSNPGLSNAVSPGLTPDGLTSYSQPISLSNANLPPIPDFNLSAGVPSSTSNFLPSESAGLNVSPSAATTARTAGLSTTPTPDKFIGNLSGKDVFKYGTAIAASVPPPEFEPPQSTAMLRPYDYSFNPITGAYDPRPGDSSEVLYGTSTFTPGEVVPARAGGMMSSYASGGLAAFKEGGRPKSRRLMDEKGLGGIPYYDFMGERGSNLDSVEKNFAQGGTPRFLSGGGDGMSDDIPAMIGDKQPARLADGEFVIPADVVSHIGNGSSKAGAKRLYKMMADIREERTGKTKQAPAIKPDRYMPA